MCIRDRRTSLGLRADAFLVSSYSRLVPRKGMDTLIRAAARLKSQYPNLQVAIGGAGRDEKRLRELAKRLEAPVTFLGRVPDDVLPAWLGASDLMVMDCRSRWLGLEQEGFGIVFVEAAATGVAQIAGLSLIHIYEARRVLLHVRTRTPRRGPDKETRFADRARNRRCCRGVNPIG